MVGWDHHKKGQVAEVLREEAMSSEESCFEEEGETRKLVSYQVKRLPWESRKLKKYKKKLDIAYRKSLPKRARDRILPREVSENLSARDIPEDLPGWAKV